MSSLLQIGRSIVNKSLAPIGIEIRRKGHDWSDTANFIPFEQTIAAARAEKLSVGDYVDAQMNGVPGSSQRTIDQMQSMGVFVDPLKRIVEIGPGTGRYLEKTIKLCCLENYELYETSGPWADYLVSEYPVNLQPTDGYSMASTADQSADLVHAHKVFSTVPFLVTCCYWHKMVRVIRSGGWAVFDIMTENCLRDDAMGIWAKSGIRNGSFPSVVPRSVVIEFFTRHQFTLGGSAILPMPPGTTELFAFRKQRH